MKATQVFLILIVLLAAVALLAIIVGVASSDGPAACPPYEKCGIWPTRTTTPEIPPTPTAPMPWPPTPPYSEALTPTPDPYPGLAPTATPAAYPQGAVVEQSPEPYLAESFTPDDAGLWAWIWDLFTGG